VDIAAMKSVFIPISKKWVSWRNKVFAFNAKLNGLGSIPKITNFMVNLPLVKKMGLLPKEKYRFWLKDFRKWYEKMESGAK
jgi:hypothetical protein